MLFFNVSVANVLESLAFSYNANKTVSIKLSSSCLVKQELYECARSSYAQRFRTKVLVNQVHASIYSCQVKERLLSEAWSIFKESV
jgi:hypothetical protein